MLLQIRFPPHAAWACSYGIDASALIFLLLVISCNKFPAILLGYYWVHYCCKKIEADRKKIGKNNQSSLPTSQFRTKNTKYKTTQHAANL